MEKDHFFNMVAEIPSGTVLVYAGKDIKIH